ncbi:hypothetical protein [Amycolatopsis anabasis]|uniref:hypothetical protein n=1 Tax=Amycolatopsis anabasis TaxID=1840409 RepID=UPI00131B2956|nr:hypothetical protein [Amycolatopsis anabasis]
MSKPDTPHRFRDREVTSWDFVLGADEVLVHCPRCDARAKVISRPGDPPARLHDRRRLVCFACGHAADETREAAKTRCGPAGVGTVRDPFFGCRLWLQADCRGEVLWAYNLRHLAYLRSYVEAGLREKFVPDPANGSYRRMTMTAKLPAWLKSAKNRSEVLRVIDRLGESGGAR